MTWLFIEPSDVWFFRDGRPFDAGESHAVRSIFPPTPFTIQGAIRSLILGHSDVTWREFAQQATPAARQVGEQIGYPADGQGRAADLGAFSLSGPFIARRHRSGAVELLLPLPADACYRPDKMWQAMQPGPTPFGPATNDPAKHLHPLLPADLTENDDAPPKESGLLDEPALASYLNNTPFRVALPSAIHLAEARLGIEIDYTVGHARDQMLYNSEFIRLSDEEAYGLAVRLGPGTLPPQPAGVMALGGEARGAHYQRLQPQQAPAAVPLPSGLRFKLLLLTPAWFSGGWQPAGGDWAGLFGAPAGVTITCVSVAMGRPQYIGGWDVANNRPKPLRAFVPPASVYYFQASAQVSLPGAFTETPPGDLSLAKQGFGAYVGAAWEWATVSK